MSRMDLTALSATDFMWAICACVTRSSGETNLESWPDFYEERAEGLADFVVKFA